MKSSLFMYRMNKSILQWEAAAQAGIDPTKLSRAENNRIILSDDILEILADLYGVKLDKLKKPFKFR